MGLLAAIVALCKKGGTAILVRKAHPLNFEGFLQDDEMTCLCGTLSNFDFRHQYPAQIDHYPCYPTTYLHKMAEAIGLVLGVAGLAGLFNACIEAISLFHASRSHERDFEIIMTRLEIEKTIPGMGRASRYSARREQRARSRQSIE